MACYATTTDINVLDAWNLVDSTSFLDSETASTAVSTSALDSSSFTPGAIEVWGMAVKFISRASSSGTFTVVLRTGGADVAGTSVTIDNTSIPALGGWVVFKFSAPVTLAAATAYTLRVVGSVGSSAVVYRNSTANNWSRALITTTTAVPTTNDQLIIAGYYTGTSGAGSDVTVTLNQTGTPVQFGTTSLTQSISVATRGIFALANAASTNYTFKHRGICQVRGGTLNLGTSGARLDSSSTFVWTADSVATADSGWNGNSGTMNVYGANNRASWTTLEATVTAGASKQITVASTTGFLAGDTVYLTCTNSATRSEDDFTTITSIDSATLMTLTSLTYGHIGTNSGNNDLRARVVNLSRNILFLGNSTSLGGYFDFNGSINASLSYAAFWYMGSTATTAGKRGMDVRPSVTTATFSMDYCTMAFGGTTNGQLLTVTPSATPTTDIAATNSTFVLSGSTPLYLATAGVPVSITYCLAAGNAASSTVSTFGTKHTVRYCELIGSKAGGNIFGIFFQADNTNTTTTGNHGDNYIAVHNYGVGFTTNTSGIEYAMDNLKIVNVWTPLYMGVNAYYTNRQRQRIQGMIVAYCSASYFVPLLGSGIWDFIDCSFETTLSTNVAVSFGSSAGNAHDTRFINCSFSVSSWASVVDLPGFVQNGRIRFINCTGLPSANTSIVTGADSLLMYEDMVVSSQKHNGTEDDHRAAIKAGHINNDTTLFSTGTQSARITPNSATVKCGSALVWRVRVTDGGTISPTVTWRKSDTGAGDSASYNGNHPRLILRRNDAVGIAADTVLATGTSSANGAWETIGGTSGTFTDDGEVLLYVDCDGTTGWLNIDAINSGSEENDMTFWTDGLPVQYLSGGGGGGSAARYNPFHCVAIG